MSFYCAAVKSASCKRHHSHGLIKANTYGGESWFTLQSEDLWSHLQSMGASSESAHRMADTRARIRNRDTNLSENGDGNLVTNWHRTVISIWKWARSLRLHKVPYICMHEYRVDTRKDVQCFFGVKHRVITRSSKSPLIRRPVGEFPRRPTSSL